MPLSHPITGMAACCAQAASGHAIAALPAAVSNSRRPMLIVIGSAAGGITPPGNSYCYHTANAGSVKSGVGQCDATVCPGVALSVGYRAAMKR